MLLIAPAGLTQTRPEPLLCAAAADLAALEPELSARFPGVKFTFGSSGTLARQIENGAPYDLYLSANQQFVADLAKSGRVLPDSLREYARGRLAIYSKSGAVRNLADLAKADRLAIANPVHAPYGLAARQVLEGRGLWDQMRARIVYAENIRQTLQFAESGNVDAALVAWSLVVGRPGAVLLDDKLHAPIRQAGGIVAASRRRDRARALLDFLTGPEGRRLLERNGFSPPDPPR